MTFMKPTRESEQPLPRDDMGINILWDYPHPFPRYEKFNDVRSNPALPRNFRTKFDGDSDYCDLFMDYKSTPKQAIYCTEINRHAFYQFPDQSTTSTSNINTDDKRKLLTYVLSHGQKIYSPNDEMAIKREIATQLAVWLIAEGVYTSASYDSPAIDSVLGGATSPSVQFAPTREVGDMARVLLDAARIDTVNPSPIPIYPSFAVAQGVPAPEYKMEQNNGLYHLTLTDTNNMLWDYPEALSINAGSLSYSVTGNTLDLSGDPDSYPGTLIELSGVYSSGTVLYLSTEKTILGTGETFQKMVRFARVKSTVQSCYLRVYRAGDSPEIPPSLTVEEIIIVNDSVNNVVNSVAKIETTLKEKLNKIVRLFPPKP